MTVQLVDDDFWRSLGRRTYTLARCTMMAVIKAANCFKAKLAKKRGAAKSGDSGGDNHGLKFYEDFLEDQDQGSANLHLQQRYAANHLQLSFCGSCADL